ncbi:sigma factor-like helix-turn-helix DNA-binding protein [Streptomyces sp. NPDC101490]|uniref:sigma factor-like helix-turn-helix DNA-binding protein n=1 Tax=Streptomyces sp. NPDC101490 TaxID=3366143 RepID=UPI00382338E5
MSRSPSDSASAVTLPTPKERRRLREALALSEEQVAEAVGVTKATVRSWETGRSSPRGRKRETYARLLGAPGAGPRADRPSSMDGRPSGPERPEASAPPPRPDGPERSERSGAGEPDGDQAVAGAGPVPGSGAVSGAVSGAQGSNGASPGAPDEAGAANRSLLKRHPQPQATSPVRTQAADSAGVRPRAAAKRTSRPPKAPAPTPAIASGPARKGAPQPKERLKQTAPGETREEQTPEPAAPGPTPEEAFDALYAHAAPGLVHQTYLLTGRRGLSREAVEYAFHHAWQHWPEVAVDPDPVGWVRATAYEYGLSPWHRMRRAHKHPDAPPTEANRRALLGALLELPPPYRRTVLLYDGLGLDLPETAAETEASTPAAANRLLHARTVLGRRVPELAEPGALHQRLGALVAEAPTATLPAARTVRTGSDRRTRAWTRAVLGVTAVLIGVTGFAAATAPTHYLPVNVPGETVNGVPVRGGPEKLRPEDVELRDSLRSQPNPGPERLIPTAE